MPAAGVADPVDIAASGEVGIVALDGCRLSSAALWSGVVVPGSLVGVIVSKREGLMTQRASLNHPGSRQAGRDHVANAPADGPQALAGNPEPFPGFESVAPADPSGLDQVASSAVGLAGSPATVILLFAAWSASGMLVAYALTRRGHDLRTMGGLGVALGPFLLALASGSDHLRRPDPEPIVIDPGERRAGLRVMIGVGVSSEAVADVEPLLRRLDLTADAVGGVDLVARISLDEAANPDSWSASASARAVQGASAFMADFRPGLILVPGPSRSALGSYAAQAGYDLVVMSGSDRELKCLGRSLAAHDEPSMLIAPTRQQQQLGRRVVD